MKTRKKTIKWTVTALVLTVSILAGFGQAIDRAREKAEQINCSNNLKQVGLAFRIWASSHGDQFPFNVPAKYGGSLESCARGDNGFDTNSWKHFRLMANELSRTKILVCPSDMSNKPAKDFVSFGSSNVTYQIHSGTNISDMNPSETLVRCPIHEIKVLCDGSVQMAGKK